MAYSNDYPLEPLELVQKLEQAMHEMNLLDEQQKEREEQRKAMMKWARQKPLSPSESTIVQKYIEQYKESHGVIPQVYFPKNR